MIRPSLLPLADKCGYAVELAEKYPQGSEASEAGRAFHEAAATPDWKLPLPVAKLDGWEERQHEVAVKLVDLDDGSIITAGTADMLLFGADTVTVIDWKTGDPARVPDASQNLQLLAYGLAAARDYGKPAFRVGSYFTRTESLDMSPWFTSSDFTAVELRIKKAAAADRSLPIVGQHCDSLCYRRSYCRAFLLPALDDPPKMLATVSRPGELTLGQAQAALRLRGALKEITDVLDARLRDYARAQGGIEDGDMVWGPVTTKGRRSISLEDVEKDARIYAMLDDAGMVKTGKPYETFRWQKKKLEG